MIDDLDAIGGVSAEVSTGVLPETCLAYSFAQNILSQSPRAVYFVRQVSKETSPIFPDPKDVFCRAMSKPTGKAEARAKISWGGEEGIQISGGIGIEAQDDKGNKFEAQFEQNSDGTGDVSIAGSHEKKKS